MLSLKHALMLFKEINDAYFQQFVGKLENINFRIVYQNKIKKKIVSEWLIKE